MFCLVRELTRLCAHQEKTLTLLYFVMVLTIVQMETMRLHHFVKVNHACKRIIITIINYIACNVIISLRN